MRKLALITLLASLFCLATEAQAQVGPVLGTGVEEARTLEASEWYDTEEACIAALVSGKAQTYEPKYYGTHRSLPVNGTTRVLLPLESDACVRMRVENGKMQFVAQKKGTAFRAHVVKGMLVVYKRHDCGNDADKIVYPPPSITRGLQGIRGPQGIQGPPGRDGRDGVDGIDGCDAGLVRWYDQRTRQPGPCVPVVKKKGFPWKKVLAGSVVVGAIGFAAADPFCWFREGTRRR